MSTSLARQSPSGELQDFLRANQDKLAQVCGKHLTPERIIQLAVLCTYRTPKLAECDRGSILASVVQASSLGLDLSPSAGEAYLIPRWNKQAGVNECQFQVGYQGLTKLVRNTGEVPFIQARLVHKQDAFRVAYEDERTIFRHEPCLDDDPGPITHVYAVAKLKTGDYMIEIMTRSQVEEVRAMAKSPDSGPWVNAWGEMAKKTVIRRFCKSLPKSAELLTALEIHDSDFNTGAIDSQPKLAPPQNDSGHGRGQYASPEQVKAYLDKINPYLAERDGRWLDRFTTKGGEIPEAVKSLCNLWQLDNHILKWCIDTGRLDPASMPDPNGQKNRQIGHYTAIVYHRGKAEMSALLKEVVRYLDQCEERQLDALMKKYPELFADDAIEAEVVDDTPDEATAMADED